MIMNDFIGNKELRNDPRIEIPGQRLETITMN